MEDPTKKAPESPNPDDKGKENVPAPEKGEVATLKEELAREQKRTKEAQLEMTRKSQELAEFQKNAHPKEPDKLQSWSDYEAKARADFDDDPVSTMLRLQLDNAAARDEFQKTVQDTLTKAEERQMRMGLQSDPNAKPTLDLLDSLKTLPLHEQVTKMQEFMNASGNGRPPASQLGAGGTDVAGALDLEPTKAERLAKDPEAKQLIASGQFKDANDLAAWSEQNTTPKNVSDDLMGTRPEGE